MKKTSQLLLGIVSLTLISSASYADEPLLFNSGYSRNKTTLFSINFTTRNGRPISGRLTEQDYLGYSQSAPCSDLRLLYSGSGNGEISPGIYPMNAEDFKEHPGPGYTCYRMDITISGKLYSTGNIQLTWDPANRAYIDANPKVIQMDIR